VFLDKKINIKIETWVSSKSSFEKFDKREEVKTKHLMF